MHTCIHMWVRARAQKCITMVSVSHLSRSCARMNIQENILSLTQGVPLIYKLTGL